MAAIPDRDRRAGSAGGGRPPERIGLEGLSLHSYTGECPPGVVLGHAYLTEPAIEHCVELLAEACNTTPT